MSDTSELTERDMALALGYRDVEILRLRKQLELSQQALRKLEGTLIMMPPHANDEPTPITRQETA